MWHSSICVVWAVMAATVSHSVAHASQTPRPASSRILVVVGSTNPVESLSRAEVRRIFLREKLQWPNHWPISVFERPADHPIRSAFSSSVLGKAPGELAEYWLNLTMTRGLDPPRVSRTGTLLKHYLDRVQGGIGYVYESELESGMKVVASFESRAR